jgi:hypothetical protein
MNLHEERIIRDGLGITRNADISIIRMIVPLISVTWTEEDAEVLQDGTKGKLATVYTYVVTRASDVLGTAHTR